MKKRKIKKSELQLTQGNSQHLEDLESISKDSPFQTDLDLDKDKIFFTNASLTKTFYDQFYSKLKKCPFMPDFFQLVIDGTDFILPDTPELANFFGRSSKEVDGVPPVMGKSSCIYDPQNQVMLNCHIDVYNYDQKQTAMYHLDVLQKCYPNLKVVLEFTPNYFSSALMHVLYSDPNKRFILRLNENQFKEFQNQLKPGQEKIIEFQLTKAQANDYAHTREFRHLRNDLLTKTYKIRFAKPIIGTHPDGSPKYVVIASDISPEEASLDELVDAYKDRWNAEGNYNYLKNDLMIDQFSGKTSHNIILEIYVSWTLFNMLSTVPIDSSLLKEARKNVAKAFKDQKRQIGNKQKEINYSTMFQKCKNDLVKIYCAKDRKLITYLEDLLILDINNYLVPTRPSRSYKNR
ncbi:MAG: hypothetical protein Q4A59_05480 [Erysipelotrichaceae bacterium]|nr:hypothetical protein [Erysipelotrichaceae bacterium]